MILRICIFVIAFLISVTFSVKGDPATIPAAVESALSQTWVTDPDVIQGGAPDCEEILCKYIKDHWRYVLQNWNDIATSDKRKWVLLHVCESLDAENYMSFLEAIKRLRQDGKISSRMFDIASIMPGAVYRKEAFLALNYKHPRVENYLKSIRSLLPKEDDAGLNNIGSGELNGDYRDEYSRDHVPIDDLLLSPKE